MLSERRVQNLSKRLHVYIGGSCFPVLRRQGTFLVEPWSDNARELQAAFGNMLQRDIIYSHYTPVVSLPPAATQRGGGGREGCYVGHHLKPWVQVEVKSLEMRLDI